MKPMKNNLDNFQFFTSLEVFFSGFLSNFVYDFYWGVFTNFKFFSRITSNTFGEF